MKFARLACLFMAAILAVTPAAAAVPAGRIMMQRKGGGSLPPPPPPPPPPGSQTAYWGPKTLSGNGGYDPVVAVPVISAPDTANFYWDATNKWIVPKSNGSKVYNTARTVPLSGCELFTITDANAAVVTVNNCADASRAGEYTIRWRNGDSQSSSSGNNQWLKTMAAAQFGERIRFRAMDGNGPTTAYWNTIHNTGEGLYNGSTGFRFACALGTCLTPGGFTGSNYKDVGPETGGTVMLGPMTLEGISGMKLHDFQSDGAKTDVCDKNSQCSVMIGGNWTNIWIDSFTLVGNASDATGKFRPNGITSTATSATSNGVLKITNGDVSYVNNGINVGQWRGTHPGDACASLPCPASTAPSDQTILIDHTRITNVSADALDSVCAHDITITNNTLTDKKTAPSIGSPSTTPAYINPFDSGKQIHGDFTQFDMVACVYKYFPNIVITGNFIGRGLGQDSIPWWTAPPVPSPNNYTAEPCFILAPPNNCVNGGIPSGAWTPNPLWGTGSGQGLYWSNWLGNAGHKFGGTNITRLYDSVLVAPTITNNIIMEEFQRGIATGPIQGGTITGNVTIATHPGVASNLWDDGATWGFAKSTMLFEGGATDPGLTGVTVARNITGGAPNYNGDPSAAAQNVNVNNNSLATVFQSPSSNGSPRSAAEFNIPYRPIKHGPAEMSPNIYAGPICWDGSAVGVGGQCPP